MKRIQNLNKILPFIILTFLLTGCWSQKEIDKSAYVIGIGIDKSEQQGKIKVTYLISNPEVGSTQEGGNTNEPPQEIITIEANSIIDSRDVANAVVAKEITYDILDVIIVSEELAKEKDFIRWIYDTTKDREIRRDTKLIITKENASEFITRNKPKLETRLHKYFEILLNHTNNIGLVPKSELHTFFRITESGADLFLAIYATTIKEEHIERKDDDSLIAGELKVEGNTNPTQFLGSAVFKNGQMIAKLSAEETRLSQLLNKAMIKADFLTSFPDPFMKKSMITAKIQQISQPEVKIDVTKKPPSIAATIPLEVEILTDHAMINYAKNRDKRDDLKKYLKNRIEEKYVKLIKRTQDDFKGQPFGFSLPARKYFLTIPQFEAYDWMHSYPDADVKVSVDITFGEFGRQSELPSYGGIRD
ncbi:Ger(x)C family spore germination protein [Ferdinandcohnia quinoae]|uniref:Ger(X)C family spore germination protein n=1 Tax=Fredinandcohnia quinoae TaxID=2918902 RepID=A0AAW5E4V2_9BACI|nr:Ger(x)C family spore germination protein [Fredinandcohnia sp. SECRCQ15]MCH1627373.1 Ger(x)C family spore germination protein [Fredinandcohnia sp. SECRCQ15]